MKTIILAGGAGTRLAEETSIRPKPMVEIGGIPILQHILNIYAAHNHKEFIIACGYKGELIQQYFTHPPESRDGNPGPPPDWKIQLLDTGQSTQTGGRIKRCASLIKDGTFMMSYGDGVGNIDISTLVAFHREHGRLATVTAVRPPARFGALVLDGDHVTCFSEKSQADEGWINGGFMVLEPQVLDYIDDDQTIFERQPLERLATEGQLTAYKHHGFWQPMDTLREKQLLENLWQSGNAPWKM
ncbi:MAG: glucose-1-phosphate cytidylyltransferase [Phycisphaerales bacterium]|nr:glucose-1-phosphate cytidylyltransferase [Phycisphaerales bacterium]